MSFVKIRGVKILERNLKDLAQGAGRAIAIALRPARLEFAKRARKAYKALGLQFAGAPIKITVSRTKAWIKVYGGHIFEGGTGEHFIGPPARGSRATGNAFLVEAKGRALVGGPIFGAGKFGAKEYKGRGLYGTRAYVRGIEPMSILGPIEEEIISEIPELTGSPLMEQFKGLVVLAG